MLIDLRHAFRTLARQPGFAASVIVLLALGVGSASAIVAVVYALLLRPLPVAESDRLVALFQTVPERQLWREPVSGVRFEQWQVQSTLFDELAAATSVQLDILISGVAQRVSAELVSGWILRYAQGSPHTWTGLR